MTKFLINIFNVYDDPVMVTSNSLTILPTSITSSPVPTFPCAYHRSLQLNTIAWETILFSDNGEKGGYTTMAACGALYYTFSAADKSQTVKIMFTPTAKGGERHSLFQ